MEQYPKPTDTGYASSNFYMDNIYSLLDEGIIPNK